MWVRTCWAESRLQLKKCCWRCAQRSSWALEIDRGGCASLHNGSLSPIDIYFSRTLCANHATQSSIMPPHLLHNLQLKQPLSTQRCKRNTLPPFLCSRRTASHIALRGGPGKAAQYGAPRSKAAKSMSWGGCPEPPMTHFTPAESDHPPLHRGKIWQMVKILSF